MVSIKIELKKRDAFIFSGLFVALAIGIFVYAQGVGPEVLGHPAESISITIPGEKNPMTLQEAINKHKLLSQQDKELRVVTAELKTTNTNKIKINITDFKLNDWLPGTPKSYLLKIGPYTDSAKKGGYGCYGVSAIGFVTIPETTNDYPSLLRKNFPVSASSHSCRPDVNYTFIGGTGHMKPYIEVTLPRRTNIQIQVPFKIWAIN